MFIAFQTRKCLRCGQIFTLIIKKNTYDFIKIMFRIYRGIKNKALIN